MYTLHLNALTLRKLRLFAILPLLLMLAACGTPGTPVDASTPGFFNHYVIYPFVATLNYLAVQFDGNYGFSLITVTVLIRLLLMPLMLRQHRGQIVMRQKMALIQPELQALQAKYKDVTDPKERQNMQQEQLALYQKHQFNPLAIGCLPMLIQIPILSGFYFAIQATPELMSTPFLWFELGTPDTILPLLAGLVYYVQFKISQLNMTQQPSLTQSPPINMAWIGLLSPVMITVFSFIAPAAVALYWTISGSLLVIQSLVFRRLYPMPTTVEASSGTAS